ncbi:type I methionyl aminopeptidase [Silvanigrella aquatica]|uniref:Methionine aminopeptidase n=1 Tax=Silvanigrella aquatica TaxID=1915309 RepID=A0A1L4D4C8_9BACT|nr:type I methionyl aminopeptidase [Silvanigrella aquatica]APJ05027.1 type I methionyl aminopeptidase [Silvanigrella aquatica]
MIIETEEDLNKLLKIGGIVADTLVYMKQKAEPGMTTLELDELGNQFLNRFGARSAPKLTYNFPGYTCISINHHIAHGIPSQTKMQKGDIINIDVSAELDSYFADTGGTFTLAEVNPHYERLCQATIEAMYAGIKAAKSDEKISSIGRAIQKTAKKYNYTIIENLGSHGVGKSLHEEPTFIASVFEEKEKRTLKKGTVITVEPFISNGSHFAKESKDGWTLYISKNHRAAQFEHSIVVTDNEPLILTKPTGNSFF